MHTWIQEVGSAALASRICLDDGDATFARRRVMVVDWDLEEAAGEGCVRDNGGIARTPLNGRCISTTLVRIVQVCDNECRAYKH